MNATITCDDVFDRLTRGPFPGGGAEDAAVGEHLCVCHECRDLAEALRPAVDLLHEAYADESQQTSLPVFLSPLSPAPACSPARRGEWSIARQLVAASLIGVALGAMAAGGWFKQGGRRDEAASGGKPSSLAMLASLKLNEVCLPASMSLATTERLRCCTDCHSSEKPSIKGIDVARLQLACVACHDRSP